MKFEIPEAYKSIDFSVWGGIDGFIDATSSGDVYQTNRLRQIVSWLNKGVIMTANAVSQLPYGVQDSKSKDEIDAEIAWGGAGNPRTLIYKLAASLCGGAAYALLDTTSRAIVSIDYVPASTMEAKFNSAGEVVSFTRQVAGKSITLSPEQVLYIFYPDETVEVGAANIYPLKNAALPAGLIAAMDNTLRTYGERGFIPPMLLAIKGQTTPAEKEKAERWWNAFLRGWTNTVAKILNAETTDIKALGAGMDELRGSYNEITDQQIKNIATAFNIPVSLFLSDAANYATMGGERRTWYETGVFVNIYQSIEEELTKQVFSKYGRSFIFKPESLDAFQDDENAKAGSLSILAASFSSAPDASIIAANILGYDLAPEQVAAIQALEKSGGSADVSASQQQQEPQGNGATSSAEYDAIAGEMMKWQNFAERQLDKKRKRQFETKSIPDALALKIRAGLLDAKTEEAIALVFASAAEELPVIRLARAIENE